MFFFSYLVEEIRKFSVNVNFIFYFGEKTKYTVQILSKYLSFRLYFSAW